MRRTQRSLLLAVAGCAAAAGCGSEVSFALVDRRVLGEEGPSHWAVEVREKVDPLTGAICRLRGRPTVRQIPRVRVIFPPALQGDSIVYGITAQSFGPSSAFTYDVRTSEVSQQKLPDWVLEVADYATIAFSPDGRYVVYLANPSGYGEVTVRSLATGVVQARGARDVVNPLQPGSARWEDSTHFAVVYDVGNVPQFVRIEARGRVGEASVQLDTILSGTFVRSAPPSVLRRLDSARVAEEKARLEIAEAMARNITRLPPADHARLPLAFSRQLQDMGCAIPQSWVEQPNNVISGSFAVKGQKDYAVLCSRDQASVLVLFWGGPVQCARELDTIPDINFVEGTADRPKFMRNIEATNRFPEVREASDTATSWVKHSYDAIGDERLERGSATYVCREGQWERYVASYEGHE